MSSRLPSPLMGRCGALLKRAIWTYWESVPRIPEAVCDKLAEKICNLRVFEDENRKMNLNLEQVGALFWW